jgi:hypothetical protein
MKLTVADTVIIPLLADSATARAPPNCRSR